MKTRSLQAPGCFSPSALLLNLGIATTAFAQPLPSEILYDIRHTEKSPEIDGVMSGGEWNDAARYDLKNETEPGQNIPAPFATEVYLMEDGENFLVAFVAHDPEPAKLRAFYRDRDRAWPDDRVGIVLDTFNDGRRAYEFWSNALGSQIDLINDDVAKSGDSSWNAIWDSAGRITESGYVVEFRIPLRQLRFTSGLPLQTWGINFIRVHQRDVWQKMTDSRYDYARSCYLCQIPKGNGFPNVQQQTNLQLIPMLTASSSERRPNPATDPWSDAARETEAGIDVRWSIDESNLLNATLNPDFSQVEADQAQLDVNTTFSLFFPERREFFLDGADYFNTANVNAGFDNSGGQLIYTRNISDPDAGVKFTGKRANHTYAVLAANDQRTGFIIPGVQGSRVAALADTDSNNLALRYRHDFGRNLTMGMLGTARRADDYSNTMTGADMNWQVADSDRVAVQLLHSSSEYPQQVQTDFQQKPKLSDNAYKVLYSHRGPVFYWNLSSADYGDEFRADLGFVNRVDFKEQLAQTGFQLRRGPDSFFNNIGGSTQWMQSTDQTGKLMVENTRASFWINGPMQSYVETMVVDGERFYNGRYFDTRSYHIWPEFVPWNGAIINVEVVDADTVDFANTQPAESFTVRPNITIQWGRHLQSQLRYTRQTLDVAGGRLYTTNLADLRLTYQFNNNSFIRLVIIDSDTDRNPALYRNPIDEHSRDLSTQLLYSYRVNAQTRFFIGYSDASIENAAVTDLEPTFRTVFAKFSYAWQY